MRCSIALAALLCASVAQASQTVAVMPFNDLSSSSGTVGEAIRETVTSDLRELSGLRVIERAAIDRIVAEQKLQASRADLDPSTTVRVGKLLGAGLMVTGAYQKVGPSVRLTARFVRVETGEVVGTAKVDGAAAELLTLQDRITTALLKSAHFDSAAIERFAKRPRPKLHSVRTFELYGDAVVEPDDNKRRQLLEKAVAEEPTFVYASRDLDALRQRLAGYDASARAESDALVVAQRKEIARLRDPNQINLAYVQIFSSLISQRRFRRLLAEARAVIKHPPPPPKNKMAANAVEMAEYDIVLAYSVLRQYDAVLQSGEAFLRAHKTSVWFDSVRSSIDGAIAMKREAAEADAEARAQLAAIGRYANPCDVESHLPLRAYAAKRPYLEACLKQGGGSSLTLAQWEATLINLCQELGDYRCARTSLDRLKALDPKAGEQQEMTARSWPVDD